MCKDCIVADEYTAQLRDAEIMEEMDDAVLRVVYFAKGGKITKCPAFTPGGLRRYSVDERPERGLSLTPEGVKVNFKGHPFLDGGQKV